MNADPRLMKPSPYRVRIAVAQLDTAPGKTFLVGDSSSDVLAGQPAGVAVIGHANKRGKDLLHAEAGADTVTCQLADITAAMRANAIAHNSRAV